MLTQKRHTIPNNAHSFLPSAGIKKSIPELTGTISVLFFALIISAKLSAQDVEIFKPDSVKKELNAILIAGSVKIDGILNEPEWKLAPSSPFFTQIEPYQGNAPEQQTEVKVLYNRQYLYFGIFSRDTLGKKAIRATDFKRDFSLRQHDLVSLSFDGFNDKRNAMTLAANPYGVQSDMLAFDDLYYDPDWDGLWKVRTTRTDSGWYAEIAIPWQTLRYPKNKDTLQNWGFNIYRNRRITNEISALSSYPRSYTANRMDYAGLLTNLQPPPPKPNIRLQPYILGSYDHYKNYGTEYKPEEANFKVGGELKWAISPNAVMDLTANTDFAQADADRQVNNVSRFSVFFPERRQFFLENASLFGAGVSLNEDASGGSMHIQPFFSRTIGLDSTGNPIPIVAGGRYVYRSSKSNYGAILMRQQEQGSSPATNFFVGRYSKNFGEQNRVGALLTVKNTRDGSNIVGAVDGFFRIGESGSLNSMLIHSNTTTPGGKQGYAGFARYQYSNNHWKIWLTQSLVTKDFDAQMGFVSRSDVIGSTPGIIWYYRGKDLPFKKILRAWEPSVSPEFYFQASTGKSIERTLIIYPIWLNLQSGAYFGYGIVPVYQHLFEDFSPLGINIQQGEYNYLRHQIWISSNPSKIINLQGIYTWGDYFNGRLNTGEWALQFAPIPHISIIGKFNRNKFFGVGPAKTDATVDLYSIEGRLALNPRVQLIGFYQKNGENSSQNYNIRLSWEYQPLSYIYLVFNHQGFDLPNQLKQTEDHVIAKISYLRQF